MRELAVHIVAATLFYLGSYAMVTSWLWSRYPVRLDVFLRCAACSGTWYAAGVAATVDLGLGWSYLGLHGPVAWLAAALLGTWLTPVLAAAQFAALGAIMEEESE